MLNWIAEYKRGQIRGAEKRADGHAAVSNLKEYFRVEWPKS
jgi:hypothetical protein